MYISGSRVVTSPPQKKTDHVNDILGSHPCSGEEKKEIHVNSGKANEDGM